MGKKLAKKGKIAAFVRKLLKILDDQKFCDVVAWLPEQTGFQILNASKFSDQALPCYFKHKNLASFIRQLNMYGFMRPKESGQYVYCHPRFKKNNTNSLRLIQRKNEPRQNQSSSSSDEQFQCQNKTSQKNEVLYNFNKLSLQNGELKKINDQLKVRIQKLTHQFAFFSMKSGFILNMQQTKLKTEGKYTQIDETEAASQKESQTSCFYTPCQAYVGYYPIVLYQSHEDDMESNRRPNILM